MNQSDSPDDAGRSSAGIAVPAAVEILIECWWADHFPGSPVAQLTSAWNHALAAKEELKRRLATLVGGVA